MLSELCKHLKNYFENKKIFGNFVVAENKIVFADGNAVQFSGCNYFRIVGERPSINDGVYKIGEEHNLLNDTFTGAIWLMAIPKDVIQIDIDNDTLKAKVSELALVEKGYASESFGGYSYTISSSAPAMLVEMQKSIERRIAQWRKI